MSQTSRELRPTLRTEIRALRLRPATGAELQTRNLYRSPAIAVRLTFDIASDRDATLLIALELNQPGAEQPAKHTYTGR